MSNFFKRLFGSKPAAPSSAPSNPQRKLLGQQYLGAPISAAFDALIETIDAKPWPDFRREPVGFYFQKMIGYWLIFLADRALTDEQLRTIDARDVNAVVLLLFRDMFRHNAAILRPQMPDASWVDPLFLDIATKLNVRPDRLVDAGTPYDLEDLRASWSRLLAAPFHIVPEKLVACHSSIVTGARDA